MCLQGLINWDNEKWKKWSHSVVSDSLRPHRRQPTRVPRPSFYLKTWVYCWVVIVQSLSHVRFFATPWTVAPPGSSVHGILPARMLEWVAISFSRGSAQPRDRTQVSCIGWQVLFPWAIKEIPLDTLDICKKTDEIGLNILQAASNFSCCL